MSFRNHAIVAAAMLLTSAPAAAQTGPADSVAPIAAPEPAPPSAPVLTAQTAPASTLEPADAPAARVAVARARALFGVGDYRAALAEFTRAYELLRDDPRQADVLNNIAVCYERMFRYDLALAYYERYLQESTSASVDDRAEVASVLSSLRDLLGTVRLTGLAGAEVWVDDHKLGEIPLEVPVPAGIHTLEARKPGYETSRRELRVGARTVRVLDVQLAAIDTYRGLSATYFWIGTGLTAAAAVTGTAFGIAALNEDAAGEREADRRLAPDGERAVALGLKADIAFGAAAVLGVASTVLFFLTDWDTRDEDRALAPTPTISVGGARGTLAVLLTGAMP